MVKIAISYRRTDSDAVGRIFDRLVERYGRNSLFRDIDDIPFGIDFRKAVREALSGTDVLIAIIGPNWRGTQKRSGAKINEANDPVRVEIETALKGGIPLIPVLIGDTVMPKRADLPKGLQDLSFRNAANIDGGRNFNTDIERLMRSIDRFLEEKKNASAESVSPSHDVVAAKISTPEVALKLPRGVPESVGKIIPLLSRYALALTGCRSSADKLVSATVDALTQEPIILRSEVRDRVALFRLLTRVRSEVMLPAPIPPLDEHYSRLCHIPPKAMEAFLLRFLSDFGQDEAMEILGVDLKALSTLLYQASREIGRQVATDVLIIEDEKLIAMELEALIEEHFGRCVTGIARTRAEAVALANRKQPGVVLADIQLADGSSGVDAVNDILKSCAPVVIYITAYPERFLTASECARPAFLISKPSEPKNVVTVVTSGLFFKRTASLIAQQGI